MKRDERGEGGIWWDLMGFDGRRSWCEDKVVGGRL